MFHERIDGPKYLPMASRHVSVCIAHASSRAATLTGLLRSTEEQVGICTRCVFEDIFAYFLVIWGAESAGSSRYCTQTWSPSRRAGVSNLLAASLLLAAATARPRLLVADARRPLAPLPSPRTAGVRDVQI